MDDVPTIDITPDMVDKAIDDAVFFFENRGNKTTKTCIKDDLVTMDWHGRRVSFFRHDVRGSLGHQAFEIFLGHSPYGFQSLRGDRREYGKGDDGDTVYKGRVIDVKASGSVLDVEHPFWYKCNVQKDEWKRKLNNGVIQDFVFVVVDKPNMVCYILGAIDVSEFDEKKKEKRWSDDPAREEDDKNYTYYVYSAGLKKIREYAF